MNERVLFVDDEPNILNSARRMLRGRFNLKTAESGCKGLEIVNTSEPFAVVIADMRMSGMDGIEFLGNVKEIAPDTVRMMLTGNADLETSIRAVNEGHVFRFLTKPCSRDILIKSVEAGIQQYQLITAERELLEKTVNGCVKVLTDVLALMNPLVFGRAGRLRRCIRCIVERLGVGDAWRFEAAAMLSQIGYVTLPGETIHKVCTGEQLLDHERKMLTSCPATGGNLIREIPRLETVAGMVSRQQDSPPQHESGGETIEQNDEVLGGAILKVVMEFDRRVSSGIPPRAAIAQLRNETDEFDPRITTTLEGMEVCAGGVKAGV